MQEQDNRGVLRSGFAIEDLQFIQTDSVVTHWMLIRNGGMVGCHILVLWVRNVGRVMIRPSASFSLRAMLILWRNFCSASNLNTIAIGWRRSEISFVRNLVRELRSQKKSTSCIIPWYNGNSALFRCREAKPNVPKSRNDQRPDEG
jgi:hypothetical protein